MSEVDVSDASTAIIDARSKPIWGQTMCSKKIILSVLLLFMVFAGSPLGLQTYAAIEVYEFDTDTERKRYQKFIDELRCPKCKNNNLAGTNSQIAVDLRRELQKLVREGKTDDEIIDFMVTRYGDFVLYRPRFTKNTFALWVAPFVFLGVGAVCIGMLVWRRRRFVGRAVELTPEERSQLDKMLVNEDKK